MKHLSKEDIQDMERVPRLNLINSLSGIKPANLIGSISGEGDPNLAIFSSIVHLGSNPALLGFILRPDGQVRRHTYENIMETRCYTINHIQENFIEQAHYTSAKFDKGVSEFEKCQLQEEYLYDFPAPFVAQSAVKMGMRFEEQIPIKINNTSMIVGSIEHLIIPDQIESNQGHLDLGAMANVGISGLNSYYALEKIAQFPYARPHETPDFYVKKK